MTKFARSAFETFESYPFSLIAFYVALIPWVMVYMGFINIFLTPAPEGHHDYRGEGVMFGVIIALSIAVILILITTLNLIFQKNKPFYAKLVATTLAINLVLYGLGMGF